ncbi:MAG TPA: hypothetical protein VK539_12775 [Myxococcaceae bacterium]|nr:hypothetical protein [Myxococcaceae bacterium]
MLTFGSSQPDYESGLGLNMTNEWTKKQHEVCRRHATAFVDAPRILKVGIAKNVRSGLRPINGLRHPPEGDTTGWYIWAGGEISADSDFFVPLHVEHLADWCPEVIPFMGLPPGWRFMIADGHEDVWEDTSLLKTSGPESA